MFNRFNDRTRKVIMFANEESREYRHGYVGTEHILLGILKEGGSAARALNNAGASYEEVKRLFETFTGYGNVDVPQDEILLTPRAKRLVELSLIESRNLNQNYIAPEHLLLALIKEPEGVAFSILVNLGVDFNKLIKELTSAAEGDTSNGSIVREKRSKKNTPTLDKYGKDLTECAMEGKLDPVTGRDEETQRVLEVLCRRIKTFNRRR